ncbi:Glu-tRNA(Gln) amidotransferase subunit GatD [Candidatus Woesearchaeota archaeon]|nr:Glu-tRNA(Gln) amidotransferase subunit GatD [Candidatus Woesearchaeota archaeon]
MTAAKPGDSVEVVTSEETIKGTLLQSPELEKDVVIIKLSSGYNIGIDKNKIRKISLLPQQKTAAEKMNVVAAAQKMALKLPKISILHTGGTIASKVDYRTGAVYSSFKPEDLLGMFPELADIAQFDSVFISNMWSDDLRFKHFELIAKAVEKEAKKGVDGIIIGIGTDNLAVASAAMAFIVESTPIPIIFVGAQRSSDRGSSDAAVNLTCAATFIAKSDFSGVAICMHENMSDNDCSILPACKTQKLHTSRRDAFRPVNTTAIARVNYDSKSITVLRKDYQRKDKNRKLVLKPKMEEKVGLLKIHVNMFSEQFSFFKGYKGLVIEGTGLGHTPGQVPNEFAAIHKKIYPALKSVIDSGCVVVMTSQCLYGRVQMHVYDKGTDLTKLGVIPGEDMLPNTAFVKLAWLLSNHKKAEVKELITKNLRGEISERTEERVFLI